MMIQSSHACAGAILIAGLAACAAISEPGPAGRDTPLRVVTWNIEHLGEAGEGCVPRTKADISAIADHVRSLNADVVSFQEVASEEAAQAVFPANEWRLFVSGRVYDTQQPLCRQDPSRRMGHMRTGFAVRRGIDVELQVELSSLGNTAFGTNQEPHGVDIEVPMGRRSVRMLSVHLTSGCASAKSDAEPACTALYSQASALRRWTEERSADGEPWLVAGDFNRVWHAHDGFWSSALGESAGRVQVASLGDGAVDHIILASTRTGLSFQSVEPGASAAFLGLSDHEPVVVDLR